MQIQLGKVKKVAEGVDIVSLRYLTAIPVIVVLIGIFYTGIQLGSHVVRRFNLVETQWFRAELNEQHGQLVELQRQSDDRIDALAVRLARLQGQMFRLNAIGQRLVEKAKLDASEFNFSEIPAQGGMDTEHDARSHDVASLMVDMDGLADAIQQRNIHLNVLADIIETRSLEEDIYPEGRPVKHGWLSSGYGWRTDPFTGNRNFHHGIDFAGKRGSDVVTVASGIVIVAGIKGGYGKFVEIMHGDGFITRYAHNQDLLVVVGDKVQKGQTIAKLGSSGHATGPHLHFEVLKGEKKINPLVYIKRSRG